MAGAALLASVAFAAPAQARPADAHASATRTVRLKDSFFSPARVELRRGDRVRFVWAGERRHNLVGPGIPARYETPARRHRPFTRIFRRAGRLAFLCSIHPGMDITVRVR